MSDNASRLGSGIGRGLGDTTAALARYREASSDLMDRLGAGLGGESLGPPGGGRLIETADFGANPGRLRMLSYTPEHLGGHAALVVVLHGCSQTAEGYAEGAGWLALADRCGFAVLCPEQGAGNNINRCFNWFEAGDQRRGAGEPESVREMISAMVAAQGLDSRRVFVTGLSAGGAFTANLLALHPELFAAGAVIAGLPFGAAHSMPEALGAMHQGKARSPAAWGDLARAASGHAGPWPRVSVWRGDADGTVVPANGAEVVKQWLDLHGLPVKETRAETVGRDLRRVWADRSGRPVVELHTISGLAHGTPLATGGPDGCGRAGPFLIEAGVSSSLEIARFFGVASGEPHRETPPPPRASEPPPKRAAPKLAVADIGATIRQALVSAGLIKGD